MTGESGRGALPADGERDDSRLDRGGDAGVDFDVVIIGAGPAGLSAGLNLVRARRRVLVIDGNRPRHAATLMSHGFLTRDNTPPGELRRLAREEYLGYPEAAHALANVVSIDPLEPAPVPPAPAPGHTISTTGTFRVRAKGINGKPDQDVTCRAVLIATGLKETLPAIDGIRSFYGMGLFSCVQCDGYAYADQPIALIGEADDLAWRALLIAQWSPNLTVFTNGADVVHDGQAAQLAAAGVRVEHAAISGIEGERTGPTGIRLADGRVEPISGGFVRPRWDADLDFVAGIDLDRDGWGLLVTDPTGRTSAAGIYAAGDVTSPGPQQLIIAAGMGARAAATINRDLIGIPTATTR